MTDPASTAILVLGMHRSGTSALTRVLNLLGAQLGSRLMPAVSGNNENGFWENQDAVDINEQLLAGLGRHWHDVREMPPGWMQSEAAARARVAIEALLRREFAAAPLWALKDPRLCRLAPLWLEALQRLDIAARIVLTVRCPDEVAASLRARDGWAEPLSRLMWLQHMREAELATRAYRRTVVEYAELLSDWRGVARRIAAQVELDWPVPVEDAAPAVAAFLDPGARHHRLGDGADHSGGGSGSLPARLFDLFLQARSDPQAWQGIAQAGEAYTEAAALFGPCVNELVADAQRREELRHYFESLHATRAVELEATRTALAAHEGMERTQAALAAFAERMERRFHEEAAARRAEGAAARAELAAEFARIQASLDTVRSRLGDEAAELKRTLAAAATSLDVQVLGEAVDEMARHVAGDRAGERYRGPGR